MLDLFADKDATSTDAWSKAGVTEDLSGAVVATLNAGSVYNISGGLTYSLKGDAGRHFGIAFSDSDMLNGYSYTTETATVSISGFDKTLSTDPQGAFGTFAAGNTFALQPNQTYKLYLFGAGNKNNQNTKFVFGGVSKSTGSSIEGSPTDEGHFVTYEFTTPSDISDFKIDFSFGPEDSDNGAFNGAAIVSIPKPSIR